MGEQETKRLAREANRLDKECPPAIYVALHCGCIATYGEHPTQGRANLKYIRADLAEQREAELVTLLEIAKCPDANCDNKGTTVGTGTEILRDGDGNPYPSPCPEPAPCQWCHEREALLAKHKAEGRENDNDER